MKAIVHQTYGLPEVLEFVELEKPTPKDNEVLIKIRASSINAAEWYGMVGLPIARLGGGLFRPKDIRIGTDYSGVVEAVGKGRADFKVGDEVFGAKHGAYAEYVCVEKIVIPKPQNVSFEAAASVPIAGLTALQGLRDFGKVQAGQKILINGASGGVGHFAVQIAKAFGAEVTAVCSARNVEIARASGADDVIDYRKENFTLGNQKYDLVLDVAGTHSWQEYRRVLNPEARFVIIGAPKGNRLIGPLAHVIKIKLGSWRASQKATFFVAQFNIDDMNVLKEFLETGKLKPFIEKTYPLGETAEAMRRFGQGHAQGKIVLTM
ncbi:MAG: NAD(P)-dependent alcohol dehydrogenase [Anaerolineales bacterium]|nr:NAD(P)-dependent alcohol dehydrogenase [Anaerolineales bacterium]